MEIKKLKFMIAPILGLLISSPILILIFYFLSTTLSSKNFIQSSFVSYYALNSLYLIFGVGICVIILGVLTSYLSARFEYFGSKFFSLCFVLPLAYPAYIVGYTYVGLFEYRGLLSQILNNKAIKFDILNMQGAIFIFAICMFPYVYILAKVSFSQISKTVVELVSLQRINPIKAFFKVYLPLSYPAIFAGTILVIMETLSDYGTVLYFGIETFSVGIFKTWFGYNDLTKAINIAIILLFFIFALLLVEFQIRRKFRFVSSTNVDKKALKIKLKGKYNFLAFLLSFLIALLSFFIPTLVLIYWAILDFGNFDFAVFGYLFNTLKLSLSSSFIIIILSFIVVYFSRFYPSKISNFTHKLSMLGYSIPGAVVAIGLLLISNYLDRSLGFMFFNASFIILIYAYITRYFASSIGSVENGFSKINSSLDDVSKIFCKSSFTSIVKIYLPLLKTYLISGFLILYIDIAKELPATLILRPFNYDTLAIRAYELASNEMLYKTAFPSLILVSSTAIAVLLLNFKSKKSK